MKTLNMSAPMGVTGYGISGQYLFKELVKLGYDISLWPKGHVCICTDIEDKPSIQKAVDKRVEDFDINSPFFQIWHQYDLMNRMGKGPYIAYSFFELDPLTNKERKNMNVPDVMCVASQWAADIVTRDCRTDVRVLPCGIDNQVFQPRPGDGFNKRATPNTYVFFNIGKWEKRKGHDVLCNAFNRAFEPSDDVQLVMMPNNMFLSPAQTQHWYGMYKNSRLSSKIHFLTQILPFHSDVANVINSMDCGVFPARSEGWNLELLESMACGKPVITTNVSAHTEYCTKENAYLIETPNQEEAFDGTFFFGGGNWAEIDVDEEDQLIEYMRYCYETDHLILLE
jgi:glycosyltransferase involved in cell wall biosynthesis